MVSLRIERDLKKRAEEICARTGMDLTDVIRTLVRRIAIDGAIPFDLDTPGRVEEPPAPPYGRYSDFLTDDLAHVKADSVIVLLSSFAADRAHRVATERRKSRPNREKINRWEAEARDAMKHRRTINTKDEKLLTKLEKKFTTLLTADD